MAIPLCWSSGLWAHRSGQHTERRDRDNRERRDGDSRERGDGDSRERRYGHSRRRRNDWEPGGLNDSFEILEFTVDPKLPAIP